MKKCQLLCLLLSVLLLLCACGAPATESSTPAESLDTSSTAEESVTEKEPVRYTYAEEADVYDVTEAYCAKYYSFGYVGGNTVVCTARQHEITESKIMLLYDLETGEFSKSYTPKDPTENLCESFLGVRENGEFGMASSFGECVWFDKEGNYLGLDLWFDNDTISPEYHALINGWDKFFDNGDDLICYFDKEKSIPDQKEYYMLYDRTTGEKTEFLVWDDKTDDHYEYYTVLGFVGKNRILYEKYERTYQDGYFYTYTLYLRDLTTGEEVSVETEESNVEMLYLRETENGCAFVIRDRRWIKTMEFSLDGTLTKVGDSLTVETNDERSVLYYDAATRTIAVMAQDEWAGGDATITLVDADTLTAYATVTVPLEKEVRLRSVRICYDGTVQAFAKSNDRDWVMVNVILWRPET
ncbi:MAG: hypothetical protein II325_02540 [Clostridia bacterium]|nr:hypothetical protein [Clostridia bacterium]